MSRVMKICPRCGFIYVHEENEENKCQFCKEIMMNTGTTIDEYIHFDDNDEIVWKTLQLEKIKSGESYSKAVKKQRKKWQKEMHDEGVRKALEARKGIGTTVTCPYCHSTNVKKVGTSGRLLSVFTFGLASGKVGKQWHCRSCGSDF